MEKKKRKTFTEEQKLEAISLYKTGISYRKVSIEIDIPETTVKRFLKTQGLSGNVDMSVKIVGELEVKVLALYNSGLTNQEIGKKINTSPHSVKKW